MFASLLRTRKDESPETTPLLAALNRYRARYTDDDDDDDDDEQSPPEDDAHGDMSHQYDGGDEEYEDEDQDRQRDGPLLPVFSSEILDRIAIYTCTHSIRTLVIQRCETTLSWDQLRSPQVSQFLVKPIQQQILADHFSRGTIYCLLANCLQFRREGEANPGNVGVNNSRALICELLAMRLLKEFSTRELIDALSYDFNPLQGLASPGTGMATPGGNWTMNSARSARISSLEIAIRAQSKKFLAHPLVVQQLEAIWAGTIVFHSVADNLHRKFEPQPRQYRALGGNVSPRQGPSHRLSPTKQGNTESQSLNAASMRRTVTLYDPHDASLFKLSRLRVPRYRNLFSTLSFGVMLGLFLLVLAEKSDDITALEILFWIWSSGYMLDEIVGFSEQGFGLYIMSFWNAFDLGILLMFLVYYVLRLCGILMLDVHSRHEVARMAYDVLGSTAVLLFPRLFSSLDHYRYFSQLLIAFRMMAMDLVAILVLIIISCSGFFVAFTLAFKKGLGAGNTAYALFQLVMGFTPAAWDIWADYNPLGKTLLALFLFICHFLIVTILVTVLTNSFMAVVQNAEQEHQFLFAVNTISMVKSDELFSYIAPSNIVGWLLIPLKYCMPFKRFVRMNRLLIKITHLPILFSIFCYERLLLSNLAYGPTDLVEQRGRSQSHHAAPAFSIRGAADVFSPGNRLREPSITTFHKDRALEEVFRRPFRDPSIRAPSNILGRRNSSNVVSDWMKNLGSEGADAFPPQDDARSLLDQLEGRRRPVLRRTKTAGPAQQKRKYPFTMTRAAASDLDDTQASPFTRPIMEEDEPNTEDSAQQTEDDGDDELLTNDEEGHGGSEHTNHAPDLEDRQHNAGDEMSDEEYFRTPATTRPRTPMTRTLAKPASSPSSSFKAPSEVSPSKRHGRQKPEHSRNISTNTVLFSPTKDAADESSRSRSPERPPRTANRSGATTPGRMPLEGSRTANRSGTTTPGRMPLEGNRTSKRPVTSAAPATRPRPIMPPAQLGRQNPNIANFIALNQRQREPSFNAMALDLASDIGDNRQVPNHGAFSGLPASFNTQLEMAARVRARDKSGSDEESKRMSRIMLARMTTLEEGFRDVLNEVKGLKKSTAGSDGTRSPPSELTKRKGKGKKKSEKREGAQALMGSSL